MGFYLYRERASGVYSVPLAMLSKEEENGSPVGL